jgi:hypothetical protein
MVLFTGHYEAQWPLRCSERLPITPVCEEHLTIGEGWIEFRQRKHHAIAIRSLDQEVDGQVLPT